jgi:hypothetical protein
MRCMIPQPFAARGNQSYQEFWAITDGPRYPWYKTQTLVIILLGTPNLYMISLMNSTTLAAVIESASFTSIHFVNLFSATKMCVNPPLAFLNVPTRSSHHVEKGQVIGMVCNW